MEVDNTALNPASALLVKTMLEKHRSGVMDQVDAAQNADINWTACKDFTIDVGKTQIGEYIQTWNLQSCWLYSLDFLASTEEDHHTFYHYAARFSTPTPQEPVPGTASVYFVVGISKYKPQTQPVKVLFVMETGSLVHTPGKTRFRKRWLVDVIESKALLWRGLNLFNT